MKKLTILIVVAVLVGALASAAMAAGSDTQTVTFEVQQINQIAISGNPAALVITDAVPGQDPTPVTNSATSYSVTTNSNANKRITGVLSAAMPSGLTLEVALVAPPVGSSAGSVVLGTSAVNLVTGMNKTKGTGLGITYKLSATAEAGEIASTTRTVTFTVTN